MLRKTSWTRAARAIVDRSRYWAAVHGNRRVGSRHVLVALAESGDVRARRLVAKVASVDKLVHALANLRQSADVDGGTLSGIHDVPLAPHGRALLERAIDAASRTRGAAVEPAHLWLALAGHDDPELRRMLGFVSRSLADVQDALRSPATPAAPSALHTLTPAPRASPATGAVERAAAGSPVNGSQPAKPAPATAGTNGGHAPDVRAQHAPSSPQLVGAAGMRRAKLGGSTRSDEELLGAAELAFQQSGNSGVTEFVRGLSFDDRLRVARLLKRKTDEQVEAMQELYPDAAEEEAAKAEPRPDVAPSLELVERPPAPAPEPEAPPPPKRKTLWDRVTTLILPPADEPEPD
ncbi:MAG: hypothetical protein L6Q99_10435 [Planctomycetes bacterium]|nr:hypothetical protein [Planctomycetota bacterium]